MFYFKLLNPFISQQCLPNQPYPHHPSKQTLPFPTFHPKPNSSIYIYIFIQISPKTFNHKRIILDPSLKKPNLQPIKIVSLNLSLPFQPQPFPVHTHHNLNPQPPAARYKSDPKPQTDHLIPTRGAYFKQVPSKCIVNPM